MMKNEIRKIVKKALKVRSKNNIPLDNSFCIFDLANNLGAEVKFIDLSSMEGAFFQDSKTILVSTLRPEGRIRFTCAHELAHYIFDHGDHFDELVEKLNTGAGHLEEELSDLFASFLLMPETTVRTGFVRRGWNYDRPKPIEIYIISVWLGVGYTTLINHMTFSLRMLQLDYYKKLIKIQPKKIKEEILGHDCTSNLLLIDKHWNGRPVDMQVGDYLAFDGKIETEVDCVKLEKVEEKSIGVAQKPGISRLQLNDSDKIVFVRVRKKEYVGRAIFRHLGEE